MFAQCENPVKGGSTGNLQLKKASFNCSSLAGIRIAAFPTRSNSLQLERVAQFDYLVAEGGGALEF